MKVLHVCDKCGKEHWVEYSEESILAMLCKKCWDKWTEFWTENHIEIEAKFPTELNSTFNTFLKNKIVRERVEFT